MGRGGLFVASNDRWFRPNVNSIGRGGHFWCIATGGSSDFNAMGRGGLFVALREYVFDCYSIS